MPLLLALGAFILVEIVSVALSRKETKFKEWRPTQLEIAQEMYDKYGEGWMLTHGNAVDKSIRERSYEIWADKTYGKGYWKTLQRNKCYHPTLDIVQKEAWDEYWVNELGESYAAKYPCLKFPDNNQ